MGLKPPARADAQQLLHAELDQLLEDDRRARAAHAGALHRDRLPLVGAGVAEQPALGVLLDGIVEVRLGDVLRPERVAGEQAGLGVLARLGSNVDRHGAHPNLVRLLRDVKGDRARARADPRVLRPGPGRARLPRGRRPARARALHRLRASDGRLDALCHVGANVVPSGGGCGAFARPPPRRRARMIIGEEHAVDELWREAREADADAAGRSSRAAGLRALGAAAAGRHGPPRGDAGRHRALVPACAAAHAGGDRHRSARARSGGLPLADARRRSTRARSWLWVEDGVILFKAEASAWTPAAVQLQQVWVDPPRAQQGYAQRGDARPLPAPARARADGLPLRSPRERAAIRVYEAIGMRRTARTGR